MAFDWLTMLSLPHDQPVVPLTWIWVLSLGSTGSDISIEVSIIQIDHTTAHLSPQDGATICTKWV